jgi:RND family efflux transporter MFP subunit
MQKKSLIKLLPLLALSALVACSGTDDKPVAKAPLPVVVATAKTESFSPHRRLSGTVRPRDAYDVSFRVTGTILKRDVRLGQKVKAGDLIAEIDPVDQQQDVLAARASLEAAKASARLAVSEYERRKALFDKGVITRAAFEQAEEDMKVKNATVDRVRTQVSLAEENLGYTRLQAAVDGTVTAVNAEKGQLVQSGQPVFTIAADHGLQAVFDVPEALVRHTGRDDFEIALVDAPDVRAKVKLAELSPTVDRATGTIRIKADIIDPPPAMALGQSLVGYATGEPQEGFLFPLSALSADNGAPALWVVDPATRRVSRKPIRIVDFTGDRMLVDGKIAPGDMVVIDGTKFLSPDQIVNPQIVNPTPGA